jgi:hypothetical protein
MKKIENQSQDTRSAYEPPRLDVISLRGDEVLAGLCKVGFEPGPNSSNCNLPEGVGMCAEPTS